MSQPVDHSTDSFTALLERLPAKIGILMAVTGCAFAWLAYHLGVSIKLSSQLFNGLIVAAAVMFLTSAGTVFAIRIAQRFRPLMQRHVAKMHQLGMTAYAVAIALVASILILFATWVISGWNAPILLITAPACALAGLFYRLSYEAESVSLAAESVNEG